MARSDRLFRLLDALRRMPAPVTAARLAEETGVSPRSLYRDIAALRAAGARIEGEAGFGYTMSEDPALPPQMFTRPEIEAVVAGLGSVGFLGDPTLTEAAESALRKIVARLPERVHREAATVATRVYRTRAAPTVRPEVATIRAACWDERALILTYTDRDGAPSERKVWPLSIVLFDAEQVLLAWCCLRQDFRRFLFSRIGGVTETEESFRPRRVGLLREFYAMM